MTHVVVLLQRLLLEVQSAAELSPAVVPQLLSALQPKQRQGLAATLSDLRQQLQLQHDVSAGVGGRADQDGHELVQQLQGLSVVDILLLVSLASQQQWAADVSLVLLHGVVGTDRCALFIQQYSKCLPQAAR